MTKKKKAAIIDAVKFTEDNSDIVGFAKKVATAESFRQGVTKSRKKAKRGESAEYHTVARAHGYKSRLRHHGARLSRFYDSKSYRFRKFSSAKSRNLVRYAAGLGALHISGLTKNGFYYAAAPSVKNFRLYHGDGENILNVYFTDNKFKYKRVYIAIPAPEFAAHRMEILPRLFKEYSDGWGKPHRWVEVVFGNLSSWNAGTSIPFVDKASGQHQKVPEYYEEDDEELKQPDNQPNRVVLIEYRKTK